MDNYLQKRTHKRIKRVLRIRKHVRGTSDKPRLCVSKTNQHISVQLIDDEKGVTLAYAGTLRKEDLGGKKGGRSKEAAKAIGLKIGELAKKLNVERAVFDRGRFKYHGLIAELANGAREAGLQF
jgi:large subunit ribosomal protein L18